MLFRSWFTASHSAKNVMSLVSSGGSLLLLIASTYPATQKYISAGTELTTIPNTRLANFHGSGSTAAGSLHQSNGAKAHFRSCMFPYQ